MRNNIPTLGIITVDIRAKDEEDVDETQKMEIYAENMRKDLITNGEMNEMHVK